MSDLPRLVLFPGLGIDGGIFAPQRSLPIRIEVPAWLPMREHELAAEYAHRMAASIDPTGPLYLGGMSFGAMIAVEAAKLLKPRAVIAIAGCTAYEQLSMGVKAVCRIAPLSSEDAIRRGLPMCRLFIRVVGRPNREQRRFLLSLLDRADASLARRGAWAIAHSPEAREAGCPIFRIHGGKDHVVPVDHVTPDFIVPEGGHVVNVTHPAEVNAAIMRIIAKVEGLTSARL